MMSDGFRKPRADGSCTLGRAYILISFPCSLAGAPDYVVDTRVRVGPPVNAAEASSVGS